MNNYNKYIRVCGMCGLDFATPSPYIRHCKRCNPKKRRIKKYPADFKNKRYLVFYRDSFCCQECGEDLRSHDQRRHCHHIDKNTKNNDFSNLITLCPSCHSKADICGKKLVPKPYVPKAVKEPRPKRKPGPKFRGI